MSATPVNPRGRVRGAHQQSWLVGRNACPLGCPSTIAAAWRAFCAEGGPCSKASEPRREHRAADPPHNRLRLCVTTCRQLINKAGYPSSHNPDISPLLILPATTAAAAARGPSTTSPHPQERPPASSVAPHGTSTAAIGTAAACPGRARELSTSITIHRHGTAAARTLILHGGHTGECAQLEGHKLREKAHLRYPWIPKLLAICVQAPASEAAAPAAATAASTPTLVLPGGCTVPAWTGSPACSGTRLADLMLWTAVCLRRQSQGPTAARLKSRASRWTCSCNPPAWLALVRSGGTTAAPPACPSCTAWPAPPAQRAKALTFGGLALWVAKRCRLWMHLAR